MTVTSNIHIGLAAWSNHSFALGECCSNASNAYRCTTAGSSTAAPTGTGSSINNGGAAVFKWLSTAGASDYSTFAAWTASLPGTLAQPYVGLIWNDAEIVPATSTTIYLTGHTTTTTNNITLKCATGESFADNPNRATNALFPSPTYGVQITRSNGYDSIIESHDAFCVFDGMQFYTPQTTVHMSRNLWFYADTTVTRCIIRSRNVDSNQEGIWSGSGTAAITLSNCCTIDMQASGVNGPVFRVQNCPVTITNCTFYAVNGPTTGPAFYANYSGASFNVTNTAIFNYGAISNTNTTSLTARNNLTNLTSYPAGWTDTGAATLFSKTAANQFVNTASDFKLKAGADALNAGFADTTHIPSATDVYGTSRPQGNAWDIGPHELVSAAPGYRARVVRWG